MLGDNEGQTLIFSAVPYLTVSGAQLKALPVRDTGNGFQAMNNLILKTQHGHHVCCHTDDGRVASGNRYNSDRILFPYRLVIEPDIENIVTGATYPSRLKAVRSTLTGSRCPAGWH